MARAQKIDLGEPSQYPHAPERADESTVAGAPGGYYADSDEKGNQLEPGVNPPPTLDAVGSDTQSEPAGYERASVKAGTRRHSTVNIAQHIHRHLRRLAKGA